MKDIIFEVILSVVVIGLLFVAISVFQSGMELVSTVTEHTFDTEKVDITIIPTDDLSLINTNKIVTGSELIAIIRYYKDFEGIEVKVVYNSATESYSGITYEENPLLGVLVTDFMGSEFRLEKSESGNKTELLFTKVA